MYGKKVSQGSAVLLSFGFFYFLCKFSNSLHFCTQVMRKVVLDSTVVVEMATVTQPPASVIASQAFEEIHVIVSFEGITGD